MPIIHLLWDESHIWGLLLWRALKTWGIEHRLVRGEEIAQAGLSRKSCSALLVPGGWAKGKREALGDAGAEAVREYVASGGVYVGFCGGAGLGLTGAFGLGLCPWKRRAFRDRLQHFSSGHMVVDLSPPKDDDVPGGLIPPQLPPAIMAPVWWPARFQPEDGDGVSVLAAYREPASDFWVADLPLSSLPKEPVEELETLYGIRFWPHFMTGQPCTITGRYGDGRYVLSYSHLETPDSPEANAWLAHMLSALAGADPVPELRSRTPRWDLRRLPDRWDDPDLDRAKKAMENVIRLGQENLLLFRRNSWLLGWRRGIPGAALNALYSLISQARALPPTDSARDYWRAEAAAFMEQMGHFHAGLVGYLLAERLGMTMTEANSLIPPEALSEQRAVLFGAPMLPGGLMQPLMQSMDELIWRLLADP